MFSPNIQNDHRNTVIIWAVGDLLKSLSEISLGEIASW